LPSVFSLTKFSLNVHRKPVNFHCVKPGKGFWRNKKSLVALTIKEARLLATQWLA
jgi:hypothetical protein